MSKPLPNKKPKLPDLPAILDELLEEGYSLQDIADYSEVNRASIAKIKSEVIDVPKKLLYLLCMVIIIKPWKLYENF